LGLDVCVTPPPVKRPRLTIGFKVPEFERNLWLELRASNLKKKFGNFKGNVLKINIRLGECEDGIESVFQ